MDKLSMCRVCLVEDVKMYSLISVNLQELYERLTKIPFETKDKRPVQVCYLCCARLQNCYRLQAVCLKSEEFFNKVIADSELNAIALQDLNTLKTVHPLIIMSCVPSTRKDPEDDKIDEDNDFKFDPLEIASDLQVKHEHSEDSFTNEEVHIKSEVTVEEEDICAKYGDISDNRHTVQNTELEHDIQLKTGKIVLERIDLEAFKRGTLAAKSPQLDLLNESVESTLSTKSSEVTVVQNKYIEENIQTVVLKNKNIVKQISFLDKHLENKDIKTSSDVQSQIKLYNCKVCEKNFTRNSHLIRHTRIHTGEKPYECHVCGKKFIEKGSLVAHTRIHTGEKLFKCDMCEKVFIQKNYLVTHIRTHTGEKPYQCHECGMKFNYKGTLGRHTRIHTGEKPYKCIICEKCFTRKSYLAVHTRIIHAGERHYTCDICEKKFTNKSVLVMHRHKHTGVKPYKCDLCVKSYSWRSGLLSHKILHTGVKPFKCEVCGKSFNCKSNLVTHTKLHTGVKPYNCNICERSFMQKNELVRHTRKHTGEKPYKCDECGKCFTWNSSLVSHKRLHSGVKPHK